MGDGIQIPRFKVQYEPEQGAPTAITTLAHKQSAFETALFWSELFAGDAGKVVVLDTMAHQGDAVKWVVEGEHVAVLEFRS